MEIKKNVENCKRNVLEYLPELKMALIFFTCRNKSVRRSLGRNFKIIRLFHLHFISREDLFMPKTKFQGVIFGILMSMTMAYGMEVYNVAIKEGIMRLPAESAIWKTGFFWTP